MGCAGSNPLPASDTMMASATSDSRTVTADAPPMSDADKACSIVQKVVGSVNIDDVVKKIQDVGGSMENLVDETQEKFSSLFGKAEQQVEDVEKSVEEKVNDVTSTMPEKPKIQEVILLTVEETRVIPIDLINSEILTNGNDSVFEGVNNRIKEEQTEQTEIKTEDSLVDANVKQNDKEDDEVEEKKDEEEVEEKKVEEVKVEGEEEKKSDEELEEGEEIAEKENDEENEDKSGEVEE
ncbi:neurofilament medium polypeptide-like [Rhopalosiphum padi]|uniref:neurofilament medium polypeptide-like n=1 Tax=Rhopalosiphum padi TaxID=40932 RepID=UPI00298DE053|nr:neurofilament medium polypeptide-like [Rhopalosiphum padi]